MDSVVLSWILGTLTVELQVVVREAGGTAHHVWVALESQFWGNRETRALHLDAAFRSFSQGNLSITEYYRQLKKMADEFRALGEPISDRTLVLNLLRGLNERFSHLRPLIVRTMPFPAFQQVKDDLLMEEITQGTARDSTSQPRPSMPAATTPPPPSGPSGSEGNRRRHRQGGRGGGAGDGRVVGRPWRPRCSGAVDLRPVDQPAHHVA